MAARLQVTFLTPRAALYVSESERSICFATALILVACKGQPLRAGHPCPDGSRVSRVGRGKAALSLDTGRLVMRRDGGSGCVFTWDDKFWPTTLRRELSSYDWKEARIIDGFRCRRNYHTRPVLIDDTFILATFLSRPSRFSKDSSGNITGTDWPGPDVYFHRPVHLAEGDAELLALTEAEAASERELASRRIAALLSTHARVGELSLLGNLQSDTLRIVISVAEADSAPQNGGAFPQTHMQRLAELWFWHPRHGPDLTGIMEPGNLLRFLEMDQLLDSGPGSGSHCQGVPEMGGVLINSIHTPRIRPDLILRFDWGACGGRHCIWRRQR